MADTDTDNETETDQATSGPGRAAPVNDPMIPSRDGPYVAKNGGLVFIGVAFTLVAAAIVAQIVTGG